MAVTGKGKVIAVDGGNALIRVIRKSACDACEGKAACEGSLVGECSKSVEVTVLAGNEIGAGVGDEVEYTSSTGNDARYCIYGVYSPSSRGLCLVFCN